VVPSAGWDSRCDFERPQRTLYVKLSARRGPPTASFEILPPNDKLGNRKFPACCSALVFDGPANAP
jgi:hypothetical protein